MAVTFDYALKNNPGPVAQVSKPAVPRVFKPAACLPHFTRRPTWKSAIRQVWKPALPHLWAFLLLLGMISAVAGPKKEARQTEADGLFTNDVLHIIKLELPNESVRSLRRQHRKYVTATLREGTEVWTNVQVRLKGGAGSFRNLDDKPGLTLKLDDNSIPFHGLRKFHLNNSVQDSTYLSEWVGSQVFRDAGVPAARAAHAVVELNGQRLGHYVLLEALNSDFLGQYFKNSHGNLYGQQANADVDNPLHKMGGREDNQRQDLQALVSASQVTELEQLRARLPKVLDIDRFLSFMAVEVMLDQWDGYAMMIKNYEVYHDLDTGRMVFMPHDLDQLFRNHSAPIIPQTHALVARAILRDPQTRAAYRKRFNEIFTNYFVAQVLTQRIDERVAKLAPELKKYDPDLARDFIHHAKDLKNGITGRSRYLARQLQFEEPGKLVFTNTTMLVSGWHVANEQQNAKQSEVRGPSGASEFWIAATGKSSGSWRARVVLGPGHYVFEGTARSVGVQPIRDDAKGAGAGLRVSRGQPQNSARLIGDVAARKLSYEFTVTPDNPDVDLICELRAEKGEVWFEERSLRLRQVN